jgi:hypothetical protein
MRGSRSITWARLKVFFGALLLAVFALGMLFAYASSLVDGQSGHRGSDLSSLGAALIVLAVVGAVAAVVLSRRLSAEE